LAGVDPGAAGTRKKSCAVGGRRHPAMAPSASGLPLFRSIIFERCAASLGRLVGDDQASRRRFRRRLLLRGSSVRESPRLARLCAGRRRWPHAARASAVFGHKKGGGIFCADNVPLSGIVHRPLEIGRADAAQNRAARRIYFGSRGPNPQRGREGDRARCLGLGLFQETSAQEPLCSVSA